MPVCSHISFLDSRRPCRDLDLGAMCGIVIPVIIVHTFLGTSIANSAYGYSQWTLSCLTASFLWGCIQRSYLCFVSSLFLTSHLSCILARFCVASLHVVLCRALTCCAVVPAMCCFALLGKLRLGTEMPGSSESVLAYRIKLVAVRSLLLLSPRLHSCTILTHQCDGVGT